MPDVYISRAGMESKQLDEKFKSTELEEIESKFNKEKFERDKQLEKQKNQIKSLQIGFKKSNEQANKAVTILELLLKKGIIKEGDLSK